MEEHTNLINQGTILMLNRVMKDLQVSWKMLNHRNMQCMPCCPSTYAHSRHRTPVPLNVSEAQLGVLSCRMQADDEAMQTRALQALQSLAKGKRGGSNLPFQSIQTEFQRGKGLPRLVHLLDRVVTPRSSRSGQGKAIMAGAIDALAAMTRNNAAARQVPHCASWPPCTTNSGNVAMPWRKLFSWASFFCLSSPD